MGWLRFFYLEKEGEECFHLKKQLSQSNLAD